jgi:hypothetical protein
MEEPRNLEIERFAGNGNIAELKKLFGTAYTQQDIDIALENAIAYSQIQTAEYLLFLGADFATNGYNGVYYAVHNNELEGLKFAISKGVDVNGQTTQLAMKRGNEELRAIIRNAQLK